MYIKSHFFLITNAPHMYPWPRTISSMAGGGHAPAPVAQACCSENRTLPCLRCHLPHTPKIPNLQTAKDTIFPLILLQKKPTKN